MSEWLGDVVSVWTKQVEACQKAKEKQFGETARRAWAFLGKDDAILDRNLGDEMPEYIDHPQKTRINKTREFVSLMMPHIHEDVLHRTVKPRMPELPDFLKEIAPKSGPKLEDRIRAWEMQHFLNYLPGEYNLYRESRMSIQEALVKGRGVVWHEMIDGPYGLIPASNYDTVDGLLIDADCLQFRDAGFVIRRRVRQTIAVAEEFGLPVEDIRGTHESHMLRAFRENSSGGFFNDSPEDRDVCVYYEVWSRIGMGHRLRDASEEFVAISGALDEVGRHVWLAIMPGMKYPLNLPPVILESGESELRARIEWPTAFFEEPANPWPCSFLDFHPNPDNAWATSSLEAALPLQYFLDRIYSFVMRASGNTARRLIFTAKELTESVKNAIANGAHDEIVEVESEALELAKLAHVLELPSLNEDIWKTISVAEHKFEEITGMVPLLYGGAPDKQIRSASEARSREAHTMNRPNDMAKAVRDWNSRIASKEAQCARLYVEPGTVAPLFGEPEPSSDLAEFWSKSPLTYMWATLVNTDDPAVAAADMQYTCESGSGSRANRQEQVAEVQMLVQTFGPVYSQWASMGITQPYNQLMQMLGDVGMLPMSRLMIPDNQTQMLAQQAQEQQTEEQPVSEGEQGY